MIAIINYGLGNLRAFANIYKRLGIEYCLANSIRDLENADKLILPGVGAFDWAMTMLNASGLRAKIDNCVIEQKKPVLGVCVGMQIMAKGSEEGELNGLSWIDADVVKMKISHENLTARLPHMGWNDVVPNAKSQLFYGISEPRYYFLHSYYVSLRDDRAIVSMAKYDYEFTAAFEKDNIFGTQFHPEKSHEFGIEVLRNFSKI